MAPEDTTGSAPGPAAGDAIRTLPADVQGYVLDLLPYLLPAVMAVAITVTLYLLAARLIRRSGAWT